MQRLYYFLIFFLLQSCNGQTKDVQQKENTGKDVMIQNVSTTLPDFLSEKFRTAEIQLFDSPNPVPMYPFEVKGSGLGTIYFLGKTEKIRNYWNPENSQGFFGAAVDFESLADNSVKIKNNIKNEDYYIIASFLPQKYIQYITKYHDEFEIADDAITSFYLLKGEKWILLKNILTERIPGDVRSFLVDILREKPGVQLEVNQDDTLKSGTKSAKVYDGTYNIDCAKRYPSLYISGNQGQLNIYTEKKNWVSLSVSIIEENGVLTLKYNFITAVSGNNNDLDWNNISTKQPIAILENITSNTIKIKWIGLHDKMNNEVKIKENPFTFGDDINVLTKCSD